MNTLANLVIPRPILDALDINSNFVNRGANPLPRIVRLVERVALIAVAAYALQHLATVYSAKVVVGTAIAGSALLSVQTGFGLLGSGLIYHAATKAMAVAAGTWTISKAAPLAAIYLAGVFIMNLYDTRQAGVAFTKGIGLIEERVF